jgi:hypothetical protein
MLALMYQAIIPLAYWLRGEGQRRGSMSTEELRSKYESLAPFLDERQRRLWAAVEALAIGWGGVSRVARATGLARGTVHAGIDELEGARENADPGRVRRPGVGGRLTEVKDPAILATLEQLVEFDVAGDPMGETRWVRASLRRLSEQLEQRGHHASPATVRRLLVKMRYSMKGNKRRLVHSKDPARDEQFRYIASQRQRFTAAGLPAVSVDAKKKELVGNFRNAGQAWCREAAEVDEHDFPSGADCRAVPLGVYDLARNTGYVVVGVSNNTPEFAVHAVASWWRQEGCAAYPGAGELLILADGGGGNGCRCKAWKLKIQERVCDPFGLAVTVCHYPPGCSKWNPVEHRLFSQISRNWAGKPLRSLAVMRAYIRGTTTATGLRVRARLDEGLYRKGQKVTREEMALVNLRRHDTCPAWNYTISPRKPPR